MAKQPSKWIGIFQDHKPMEGESLNKFLSRLAKEVGVSKFTAEKAYHTYVRTKAEPPKFDPETPTFRVLPKSDAKTQEAFILEGKKMLVLSDVHIPYHDIPALHCAVNEGLRQKCDAVLLNGDFMDCHEISRFEKNKFKRSFIQEVQATKQFFSWLRFKFPNARIYCKCGNHELRYMKYIRANASALEGLEAFEFENILDLEKFGMTMIENHVQMKFNELSVLHGNEIGGGVSSPVNVARGLYMRAKASAICGHHHQTSEHTEVDINGKITTCWSLGCLSELRPDYMPFAKFNHGFGIISRKGNTGFHVQNFRVLNGKIL